jgi:hypothetical protein
MKTLSWLIIHFFIIILNAAPVAAQPNDSPLTIDTVEFKLSQNQHGYSLQYGKNKRIVIPREWLIPPDEIQEDGQCYVSSFNYDEPVTSFKIGDGRVGLHLSSYKIQKEGSARAAAGRDVFLVFDPNGMKLYPGGLKLGITKSRVRVMGCFSATFHSFIIGDINRDGLTDIGVVKEEMICERVYDEEKETDSMLRPYYEKFPIRWYVYMVAQWKYEPAFDGKYPDREFSRLPLINLAKSPVDFLKEIYQK